jgi:CRP-like cAMP-binding protein
MSEASDLLERLPLFAGCARRDIEHVARNMREERLSEGERIIAEGDRGDSFYAVVEGTVDVERDGALVASFGPGDFFGETALVAHAPRNASITATSPVRVLVLPARDFRAVVGRFPAVYDAVLQAVAERT